MTPRWGPPRADLQGWAGGPTYLYEGDDGGAEEHEGGVECGPEQEGEGQPTVFGKCESLASGRYLQGFRYKELWLFV